MVPSLGLGGRPDVRSRCPFGVAVRQAAWVGSLLLTALPSGVLGLARSRSGAQRRARDTGPHPESRSPVTCPDAMPIARLTQAEAAYCTCCVPHGDEHRSRRVWWRAALNAHGVRAPYRTSLAVSLPAPRQARKPRQLPRSGPPVQPARRHRLRLWEDRHRCRPPLHQWTEVELTYSRDMVAEVMSLLRC